MVLGLNAKTRKGASVHVEYLIHLHEIKPWPPSQSLKSLRSVLIQWENGDRRSGSTNTVAPSLGSVIGEGKIEFNECFRLPVVLERETSARGKDIDTFHKNCLELNLCEPRRDKTQVLATAVLDFAEYGVIKDTISISIPVKSKRSFSNTSQPVLYLKIQPFRRNQNSSSLGDCLSKGEAVDNSDRESVSTLMNEEYAEEAENASLNDDDTSSSLSLPNGVLPQNDENGPHRLAESKRGDNGEKNLPSKHSIGKDVASQDNLHRSSSCSSSVELSSDLGSPLHGNLSMLNSSNSCSMSNAIVNVARSVRSSSSPFTAETKEDKVNNSIRSNVHQNAMQEDHENVSNDTMHSRGNKIYAGYESISNFSGADVTSHFDSILGGKLDFVKPGDPALKEEDDGIDHISGRNFLDETVDTYNGSSKDIGKMEDLENEQGSHYLESVNSSSENELTDTYSHDTTRNDGSGGSDTGSLNSGHETMGSFYKVDRLKPSKSVRSPLDPFRSKGSVSRLDNSDNLRLNEWKNSKVYPKITGSAFLESKSKQLEDRIQMLERELREAATIETALYAVVAEHGSSMSKVHAPARRLSRLYHHACKADSLSQRASAAKSAVSGLVLVMKACGNNVPRLTFWLSNSTVLRAIISQATSESNVSVSTQPTIERNGGRRGNNKTSTLMWKESSSSLKSSKNFTSDLANWEDPLTFISALERVEAWVFTRIVESIWWQTFTPHMQLTTAKVYETSTSSDPKKILGRTSSSGVQDQGNFSLDLWKKAFKDACERLCPVRAGGHECGCLPVLTRLIMEQCVARLDVAMFNAILRESVDEIPSDPVSDPITDSKVLPIPAGVLSFGAGAQLKNVIGNWSRWLSDLFGIDDNNSVEDESNKDEDDERKDTSAKSFQFLNALSDLLMLPKDMLLSKSLRKEVCPRFGAPLIKRILYDFITDEFCPDPIPDIVFKALDSVDPREGGEESFAATPCTAAPPNYSPPSVAYVASIIGTAVSQSRLERSRSSVLRKSYTSEDELDELNSPLASIFLEGSITSPASTKSSWESKESGNQHTIRYELLREIWRNCD